MSWDRVSIRKRHKGGNAQASFLWGASYVWRPGRAKIGCWERGGDIGYELPGSRRPYVTASERNVIAYVVDEISTSPHPVVSFDGARDGAWENGLIVAAHV